MANNRKYESYYSKYSSSSFDSRWAERDEIESMLTKIDLSSESIPTAGVPYISDGKTAFVDTGDNHSIVIGSSGSKKSRNVAFPATLMLMMAGESMIINDPKGENFDLTSGFAKAKGYDVFVIDIRRPYHSHRWNPFYEPWMMLHKYHNIDAAYEMINDFVFDFFKDENCIKGDAYWDEVSSSFAVGLIASLLICSDVEEASVKSLINMRNEGIGMNGCGKISSMYHHLPKNSYIFSNLNPTFTAPERTFDTLLSVYDSKLRLFSSQPGITELFSGHEIDIRSFGEKKSVLYIISPDEKTTYSKLITTFIHQAYSVLISHASSCPNRMLPLRVNFILDEFAQLPYIQDFPAAVSAARSRNIRFTLFIQSLHQLTHTYNQSAETILGNTGNTIFLTSRELPLLNRISDLCGRRTDGQYLISPSRLQRLNNKEKGEALILIGNCYPYITNLADISDYDFDPNKYPPIQMPRRTDNAPLFDMDKLVERRDWLCDNECKFEPINSTKKNRYAYEEDEEDIF